MFNRPVIAEFRRSGASTGLIRCVRFSVFLEVQLCSSYFVDVVLLNLYVFFHFLY